jgi:hypothetical protein
MTSLRKTLMVILLAGAGLSVLPSNMGVFSGLISSAQAQGYGGARGRNHGGGAQQSQNSRPARVAPPPRDSGRGRMSEEDRRQLRRDIDKANREIYGGRRR